MECNHYKITVAKLFVTNEYANTYFEYPSHKLDEVLQLIVYVSSNYQLIISTDDENFLNLKVYSAVNFNNSYTLFVIFLYRSQIFFYSFSSLISCLYELKKFMSVYIMYVLFKIYSVKMYKINHTRKRIKWNKLALLLHIISIYIQNDF